MSQPKVNYSLTELNALTGVEYAGMTFPSYRHLLQTLKSKGLIVAVGAKFEQKPIALGLARLSPQEDSATILSIFVEPAYRSQGIGRSLLVYLEQVLQQRGCKDLELVYTAGKSTTPHLEHILQKDGWNPPSLRMLICKALPVQMMEAPWLHKYSLPSGFTMFPWCDLTEAERNSILEKQNALPWYPEELSPFSEEEIIEPLNSLGLRYQGEVIGWMITHRLAPDTIRYSRLFIKKELQKLGRAIPLLAESIKMHYGSHIPYGIWTVSQENSAMVNFVKSRMADYMLSIKESRGVSKMLSP